MSLPLRILIIEDSEDDAILLLRELRKGGYEPIFRRIDTAEAMNAALDDNKWDIIVSDYVMPRFSGLDALDLLKEKGLDIPFVMISGKIGEETAVKAMKAGAHDYILKGNLAKLIPVVERELGDAEVRRERTQAEETNRQMRNYYEEQQKQFFKQTIFAATGGKLVIAEHDEMNGLNGNTIKKFSIRKPLDIGKSRHWIKNSVMAHGMSETRADNLMLCVGEAATNALKHAGGGDVALLSQDDQVIVRITDHGPGMDALVLPRVMLELGYSTGRSLGMGYAVILALSDKVLLNTSPVGTTLVIEMDVNEHVKIPSVETLPDTW